MSKLLVVVFTFLFSGILSAGVIYDNDMSSLDGWSTKGGNGIYTVDDSAVKFNGLKSILSTQSIWSDTSIAIQDETEYVLTVNGATHSLFKSPLKLSLFGVEDDNWSTITSDSQGWSKRNVYQNLVLSFSTVGSNNDLYVGQSLGIALDAGWLNSLTVDNVSIESFSYGANVPEPATIAIMSLGCIPILMRRKQPR